MDPPPEKKIIVIVEDTPEIAELIKDTLNAEPAYQALTVGDGARGIRQGRHRGIIPDVGGLAYGSEHKGV